MATEAIQPRTLLTKAEPESKTTAAPAAFGLTAARVLTVILALLIAVASAAGLWVDGLYRDPGSVAAMFRGYDVISLVVLAPLLMVSVLPRFRRSPRALLLWVGMLAYAAYNYAFYVFGASFDALFLAHVAVFSLSLFALVLALKNLDVESIKQQFAPRTPVRWIAGILMVLALALGAMWIFLSLQVAFTNQVPAKAGYVVLPAAMVHLGWVLDLALIVPAYALAGVLLWRRAAWGFLLATLVLVSGAPQQFSYMSALVFQSREHVPGASPFDPMEPVIALAYLVGAVLLLVNVRPTPATRQIGGS